MLLALTVLSLASQPCTVFVVALTLYWSVVAVRVPFLTKVSHLCVKKWLKEQLLSDRGFLFVAFVVWI